MTNAERALDTSDWGRVLVWEVPSRPVLTWGTTTDWMWNPELETNVDVRFVAGDRVERTARSPSESST